MKYIVLVPDGLADEPLKELRGKTPMEAAPTPNMDFLAQTPEWNQLTRGRINLIEWLARMNERKSMAATTWEAVSQLALAS